MKYARLYSDESGASHFEDVEIELKLVDFAPPAPPVNLSSFIPTTQIAFVSNPAGWHGDWHPTPKRQFGFFLSGEWKFTASDGEVRHFSPGAILLVEDTTGKGHTSQVVSDSAALAVVAQLSD